ncbi:hypothetical protein ACFLYR_06630, partial [Chloroflexota bacterium]
VSGVWLGRSQRSSWISVFHLVVKPKYLMKRLRSSILHSTWLILLVILLFNLLNCSNPPTTSSPETGTVAPGNGGGTSIYSWVISDTPRGLKAPPNEKFFKSNVEARRIDSKGGELLVKMNPIVDLDCVQQFMVGWEFIRDIKTVREGETIDISVFNKSGLTDCYKNAKNAMAYGGEVVIELKPSGGSHFLSEDRYKHYHEGKSQYLFVVTHPTGIVYPAEPASSAKGSTGGILVKDGVHEIGETDAPHGNFSFTISAGSVFAYTVTYLYDAIPNADASP